MDIRDREDTILEVQILALEYKIRRILIYHRCALQIVRMLLNCFSNILNKYDFSLPSVCALCYYLVETTFSISSPYYS